MILMLKFYSNGLFMPLQVHLTSFLQQTINQNYYLSFKTNHLPMICRVNSPHCHRSSLILLFQLFSKVLLDCDLKKAHSILNFYQILIFIFTLILRPIFILTYNLIFDFQTIFILTLVFTFILILFLIFASLEF